MIYCAGQPLLGAPRRRASPYLIAYDPSPSDMPLPSLSDNMSAQKTMYHGAHQPQISTLTLIEVTSASAHQPISHKTLGVTSASAHQPISHKTLGHGALMGRGVVARQHHWHRKDLPTEGNPCRSRRSGYR